MFYRFVNKKNNSLIKTSIIKRVYINYMLAIVIFSTIAIIIIWFYFYTTSKVQPYIVKVDKQDITLTNGAINPDYTVPGTVIASILSDFITNIRVITSDSELQTKHIHRAYSHLRPNTQIENKVREFYERNNPFELEKKYTRSIHISNVLNQSESTLQIDFTENVKTESGSEKKKMRALISYEMGMISNDPIIILQNPLGIYVTDYVLSEVIT